MAKDLTPSGARLGGTVAYAGLTAAALGAHVGIITACADDLDLQPLMHMELVAHPSSSTTTFTNRELQSGREQTLQSRAEKLTIDVVPLSWRRAAIIHLAPIADEIDLDMLDALPAASIYLTPQGWLRTWDQDGRIARKEWDAIATQLALARAVVCSSEDLGHDAHAAHRMAQKTRVLAVTRSHQGAWLFVEGERSEIPGEDVEEVDPTGSGDIFSAAFFWELHGGSNPFQAAQFANRLAARSVTRAGLDAIPTDDEIAKARGSN
ncbi:MAG: PfkB family carbohydrate kinase [Anaerolineales bacterium]|nr:PfkB family carbohydrate kinase [Anaerolineales bacterium]